LIISWLTWAIDSEDLSREVIEICQAVDLFVPWLTSSLVEVVDLVAQGLNDFWMLRQGIYPPEEMVGRRRVSWSFDQYPAELLHTRQLALVC
jgi:hypothetical protein